jgi:hypothetical protein
MAQHKDGSQKPHSSPPPPPPPLGLRFLRRLYGFSSLVDIGLALSQVI